MSIFLFWLVFFPVQDVADQAGHELNQELERFHQNSGFSGVVLVGRKGTLLLLSAYGSVGDTAMRTGSRFWISSMGKQFTSAAIMKCREKGYLSLEDPLSKFFPGVPKQKSRITVRQLLAHMSGLGQAYDSEGAIDREQATAFIFAQTLEGEPGQRFRYSNSNYQLAVAIIETVTGMSYRTFVEKELLEPAGLRDTGQSNPQNINSIAPTRHETPARLKENRWGGQGYYSTAEDLYRWYEALRSGAVLEPKQVSILFEPVTTIGEGRAAFGWFLGKSDSGVLRYFTRGNDDYGANSLIYAYPETETVIIVLTHAGEMNGDISFSRAAHSVIEGILFSRK